MIETTIEWYTLDEKLPYDGECFSEERYAEVLGAIRLNWDTVETFRYMNNQLGLFSNGKWVDFTNSINYWAYVPMIGE